MDPQNPKTPKKRKNRKISKILQPCVNIRIFYFFCNRLLVSEKDLQWLSSCMSKWNRFYSEVVLSLIFGRLSFCLILFGVSLEGYEFAHQVLVHIHHCRIVIKITAIILRTENRY